MRTHPLPASQVRAVALGGGLVLLAPLHVALGTTRTPTFVLALTAGAALAGLVGAGLVAGARRAGLVVGLVTAVMFVLVALLTAGALCAVTGHTWGVLAVGPPAVVLTLGAVSLSHRTGSLWIEDLTSALGAIVLVVVVGGAVAGFFLTGERGATLAEEARGAELETLGLTPYAPELAGYRRDHGEDAPDDDPGDYWLHYVRKVSPYTTLSVRATPLPDEVCQRETCTVEDGYWLETVDDDRVVMVRRGDTLLTAWLAPEDRLRPVEVARVLREAPTSSWYDVLDIEPA
ncbi:hypothetical protein [Nocardioides nitrophenolicus]|uniref:hypothetical protein n=1 Tax=Nocardioides nitrophenolicus TaxID=60489 RepID=UPI00195F11AE|nr:hypothetical protein [Nocardioides nitrophenolicus]MBM7515190.1 hypothetical protein [Nocardioides nitrophenolicus]